MNGTELVTYRRFDAPDLNALAIVDVEVGHDDGESMDVGPFVGRDGEPVWWRVGHRDLLILADDLKAFATRIEYTVVDARQKHADHARRLLCHWCGTTIAEDEPHCGADLCSRRYEAELAAEAVDQ